ncbi:MAG: hypothetical protein IH624_18060 [Phycisphaerae bacterium]|nr:hypothetical protein [Phycisphaerae bacterium]
MIYGIADDGNRIRAVRGVQAVCPHCRADLIAKCGAIVVHHWAHREAKDCVYARGMTQWHYDWLVRYEGLGEGWEIEHFFDAAVRFDAYNAKTRQAIEFQRIVDVEYIEHKTALCRAAGIALFWLIDPQVFSNFVYAPRYEDAACDTLFSPRRCGRRIMLVLEKYSGSREVRFLIDFTDEGRLPRYCADDYRSQTRKAYRARIGDEAHPMTPGLYRVQGVRCGRDAYFREECVLEVRRQERKYNL